MWWGGGGGGGGGGDRGGMTCVTNANADSACPFLPLHQYRKGHAESAFRDACRTSSGWGGDGCHGGSSE